LSIVYFPPKVSLCCNRDEDGFGLLSLGANLRLLGGARLDFWNEEP